MELSINISEEIFQLCNNLLLCAGLWALFVKCGKAGWWALIPGFRYLKLGECAGREREGGVLILLDIALVVLRIVRPMLDPEGNYIILVELAIVAVLLMEIGFVIRVYGGLCRVFGRKSGWVAAWFFFESITALIWGFSPKFQPIHPEFWDEDGNEVDAGYIPADLPQMQEGADGVPLNQGLHINIRQRTVRDFMKKRYLLKNIKLAIPEGSLVLLLGGSGAGKTTFINAVTGYEKADAEILLKGKNVYDNYEDLMHRIGMVPQQDLLRMNDTVIHTLEDAALLRLPIGVKRSERNQRIEEVMDVLGLTAGKLGLVSKKSGGQKKRISIGTELITDPDLFILDEPDSGLDGVLARELFTKLRQIADQGKIVIAITHTPDRVVDLFDKVIVLARDSGRCGRLAFYGSPDEARTFFDRQTMEEIVMRVNREQEGGEGKADEYIAAFAEYRAAKKAESESAEKDTATTNQRTEAADET